MAHITEDFDLAIRLSHEKILDAEAGNSIRPGHMRGPVETRTFSSGHAGLCIGMQKDIQSCSVFRVSQMKRGLAISCRMIKSAVASCSGTWLNEDRQDAYDTPTSSRKNVLLHGLVFHTYTNGTVHDSNLAIP